MLSFISSLSGFGLMRKDFLKLKYEKESHDEYDSRKK